MSHVILSKRLQQSHGRALSLIHSWCLYPVWTSSFVCSCCPAAQESPASLLGCCDSSHLWGAEKKNPKTAYEKKGIAAQHIVSHGGAATTGGGWGWELSNNRWSAAVMSWQQHALTSGSFAQRTFLIIDSLIGYKEHVDDSGFTFQEAVVSVVVTTAPTDAKTWWRLDRIKIETRARHWGLKTRARPRNTTKQNWWPVSLFLSFFVYLFISAST